MYTFRFQPPKNTFLVFQSTKYCIFGDDFVKSRGS
jgi:TATA-box binding protein (TBP) (component of TFIID and TFIIIB)